MTKYQPTDMFTVIDSNRRLKLIDLQELFAYRDLFAFWIWRSIRVRYAQSALGVTWAIIQPVFSMLVFTVIFGKLAKIQSDGIPYSLFSFAALVPWTFFSNAVVESTTSLITNANMISKIYFPRIILPLGAVLAKCVDLVIALCLLFVLMLGFGFTPTWKVVILPVLLVILILSAAGVGIWLTAMAIQYRDVKYGLNFAVQLLMYAAPVVYPASLIPSEWRCVYALNPLVGVIEGFRASLLGTHPIPIVEISLGMLTSVALFLTSVAYFQSKERLFADVA